MLRRALLPLVLLASCKAPTQYELAERFSCTDPHSPGTVAACAFSDIYDVPVARVTLYDLNPHTLGDEEHPKQLQVCSADNCLTFTRDHSVRSMYHLVAHMSDRYIESTYSVYEGAKPVIDVVPDSSLIKGPFSLSFFGAAATPGRTATRRDAQPSLYRIHSAGITDVSELLITQNGIYAIDESAPRGSYFLQREQLQHCPSLLSPLSCSTFASIGTVVSHNDSRTVVGYATRSVHDPPDLYPYRIPSAAVIHVDGKFAPYRSPFAHDSDYAATIGNYDRLVPRSRRMTGTWQSQPKVQQFLGLP